MLLKKSIGAFFKEIRREKKFDREGKFKKWGEKKFSLSREKILGPNVAKNLSQKKKISHEKKIIVVFGAF